MNPPRHYYYPSPHADTLAVVLPGFSDGIDSRFFQRLVQVCQDNGQSVVAFDFPFFERREEHSSGPELIEEQAALQAMLDFCDYKRYPQVHLIGKSLGAIVASRFLNHLDEATQKRFAVTVLGYIPEYMDLSFFSGNITIIQGAYDKYGNIEVVKKGLVGARSKTIAYYEIPCADHSYRDSKTKEPIYEEGAIQAVFSFNKVNTGEKEGK